MRRGFTLIETMIYLAIFAILIGGMVVAAYLLFESIGRLQTSAMVMQEEQFLMATIERLLQDAASVSFPLSGGSGSTLALTSFGEGASTVSLAGADIRLDGVVLNNTNVRVTSLSFSRSASTPDRLIAEITLQTNTSNGQLITYSASTTKYLRK